MANENVNQTQNSTSELAVRREKLNNLYQSGNNPFEITKYDRTHESLDAIALYEEKAGYTTYKIIRGGSAWVKINI